jgi:hypothetical protein
VYALAHAPLPLTLADALMPVPALQGLLLVAYALTYERFPGFMRVWVPLVVLLAILGSIGIEVRLAVGYTLGY